MRCHSVVCGMTNQMQSATQSAMRNCPVGFGFRVCSPYRHGRDCGTPKPGQKKQKRYDCAYAVLVIHRFPFSLLLTLVVRKIRLEVTLKTKPSEQQHGHARFHSRSHYAVIRVYDAAGNVIETHEHKGDFKEC